MKKVIIVVLILIGLFFLMKDSSDQKSQKNKNDEPIRIGAVLSLTGVAADFGDMAQKATTLAVEEINSQGGIDGRKVELYIEDDQTSPQDAVSAYNKLKSIHDVDAVIGGLFDFTAQPLFELALRDETIFVSPTNFVIDGVFDMNDYTFVMYPRFDDVVENLNKVIREKEVSRLGMIRYESTFSESIMSTLQRLEDSGDVDDFSVETYAQVGVGDFRNNILKLQERGVDAVFLDMLDIDILKYFEQAQTLGFGAQVIGHTGLRDVIENPHFDATLLNGALMLDWEISSNDFDEYFIDSFDEYPRRGSDRSYDAVHMISQALRSEDPLGHIESSEFTTRNGSFSFTEEHGVQETPIKVFEVQDGELVEIYSNEG